MAMWGKLFGALGGTLAAGPVGGIAGLLLGHRADKEGIFGLPPKSAAIGRADTGNAALLTAMRAARLFNRKDAVLSLGALALSAKLARADGPVNEREVAFARTIFNVPRTSMGAVGRLFDGAHARLDDAPAIAREIFLAFKDERREIEKILAMLFSMARADLPAGDLATHPQEERFLRMIHREFRLSDAAWERARGGGFSRQAPGELDDAYAILGVARTEEIESIRVRWKRLMQRNHPDLAGRALSEAERDALLEKAQRLNAAWDAVKRARAV